MAAGAARRRGRPEGRPLRARLRAFLTRPAGAALALLALYAGLSLLCDPRGLLGSDTGGKVATLKVMAERGRLDPDVGYWAADLDPAGRLHPLALTAPVGARWVNVTTLPMLYAGYPLYRLGGYRAALALPMLGAVAAAFAARALARRLGAGQGWAAYWAVGAASPVLVYALDFWEHAWGLAAMAWAVVLLWDLVEGRRGGGAAAAAGALFGLAATMRTEALAYGAVAVAAAGVAVAVRDRRPGRALAAGALAGAGLAGPLLANTALEVAALGQSLRAGRASSAAASAATGAAADAGVRAQEAVTGAVGLFSSAAAPALALGAAAAALLAVAVLGRAGHRGVSRRAGALAAAGVAGLYLARVALGPGVVPGLATAAPLAVVGLVLGWSCRPARLPLAVAVAALPVVWATQYPGSSLSHVGARYSLLSGLLLTTVGAAALPRLGRAGARAVAGLAVVVTAFAFSWLVLRSHAFARVGAELAARDEPVVVSRFLRLGREVGAFYGEGRWLSAHTDQDQRAAVALVERAGLERFGLVLPAREAAAPVPGWRPVATAPLDLLPGFDLRIVTYQRQSPTA